MKQKQNWESRLLLLLSLYLPLSLFRSLSFFLSLSPSLSFFLSLYLSLYLSLSLLLSFSLVLSSSLFLSFDHIRSTLFLYCISFYLSLYLFFLIPIHILGIMFICIPITFNNPFKVSFSNKKTKITAQTRSTQIVKVYFLLKNRVLTDF